MFLEELSEFNEYDSDLFDIARQHINNKTFLCLVQKFMMQINCSLTLQQPTGKLPITINSKLSEANFLQRVLIQLKDVKMDSVILFDKVDVKQMECILPFFMDGTDNQIPFLS